MARQLLVPGQRWRIAVIEEDEVDIARIVELPGPQFAHAKHGEGRGVGLPADRKLPVTLELEEDRIGEGAQAARSEVAELAGDAVERPGARDVGDGNGECHASLEAAKPGRNVDRRGARRGVASYHGKFGRQVSHGGVGTAMP